MSYIDKTQKYEVFNKDYYEDGVRKRVSAYEQYRWMPERSIREASSIINNIEFKNVLDFGCAKGFSVYAFRLLERECFGYDISEYAVSLSPTEVKEFISSDLSFCPLQPKPS